MPPDRPRKDSQERCRQGWELKRRGRTWDEIAKELGYKSRSTAHGAVTTWLRKNPPDDLETMRRASGDTLVDTIATVGETMREAKAKGEFRNVAELAKAVIDGVEKYAKLTGQHAVVPKEINVTVQSVTEIIASTRAQLVAALDAEIVDAEVVETPRELA